MTDTADLRCTAASLAGGEPLAGTAPIDTAWLFVEHPGPWGRKAVDEARLPDDVRSFLATLEGVRVQLIRRPGGVSGPGVRVFTAQLTASGMRVRTTVLDDLTELRHLDPTALAAGADPGLTAHDEPLWLVCTNGRRDRCCAEEGRPVAAALAGHWPEQTWETTHLGGHRLAATLLALPSGVTLGRVDAESAVDACHELAAGRLPVAQSRGRAGLSPRAQVAELHLSRELGERTLGAVRATPIASNGNVDGDGDGDGDGDDVTVESPGARWTVQVAASPGPARRQSCADLASKSVDVYTVRSWVRHDT